MINLRFWEKTPEQKVTEVQIRNLESRANKKYEQALRKLRVVSHQIDQIKGLEEVLVIRKQKHA